MCCPKELLVTDTGSGSTVMNIHKIFIFNVYLNLRLSLHEPFKVSLKPGEKGPAGAYLEIKVGWNPFF